MFTILRSVTDRLSALMEQRKIARAVRRISTSNTPEDSGSETPSSTPSETAGDEAQDMVPVPQEFDMKVPVDEPGPNMPVKDIKLETISDVLPRLYPPFTLPSAPFVYSEDLYRYHLKHFAGMPHGPLPCTDPQFVATQFQFLNYVMYELTMAMDCYFEIPSATPPGNIHETLSLVGKVPRDQTFMSTLEKVYNDWSNSIHQRISPSEILPSVKRVFFSSRLIDMELLEQMKLRASRENRTSVGCPRIVSISYKHIIVLLWKEIEDLRLSILKTKGLKKIPESILRYGQPLKTLVDVATQVGADLSQCVSSIVFSHPTIQELRFDEKLPVQELESMAKSTRDTLLSAVFDMYMAWHHTENANARLQAEMARARLMLLELWRGREKYIAESGAVAFQDHANALGSVVYRLVTLSTLITFIDDVYNKSFELAKQTARHNEVVVLKARRSAATAAGKPWSNERVQGELAELRKVVTQVERMNAHNDAEARAAFSATFKAATNSQAAVAAASKPTSTTLTSQKLKALLKQDAPSKKQVKAAAAAQAKRMKAAAAVQTNGTRQQPIVQNGTPLPLPTAAPMSAPTKPNAITAKKALQLQQQQQQRTAPISKGQTKMMPASRPQVACTCSTCAMLQKELGLMQISISRNLGAS